MLINKLPKNLNLMITLKAKEAKKAKMMIMILTIKAMSIPMLYL